MGNRHLETAERIFPPPSAESPLAPYMHLLRISPEKNEYTPIPSLMNPTLQGRIAVVRQGIFEKFLDQSKTGNEFVIGLLQDRYEISGKSTIPQPILNVSEHVRKIVQDEENRLLSWVNLLENDQNMIQVSLGCKWSAIPVREIAEVLAKNGIKVDSIVSTPSRKRIQNYGISFFQPIGEYQKVLRHKINS